MSAPIDPKDIPPSVIEAARQVEAFFSNRGALVWKLGGIQSRIAPPSLAQPFETVEDALLAARDLVDRAKAAGLFITIERRPLLPLAQGNYEMVVNAGHSYPRGAGKLWCISIPGPGDLHAMPNLVTAQHCAWRSNHSVFAWLDKKQLGQTPEQIAAWPARESVTAVVMEWPHDAASHAEALKSFNPIDWKLA